jgi:hypothetical protein
MNNQVELDSKTQQVLEEANIIASGEEVLAQLGIDSTRVDITSTDPLANIPQLSAYADDSIWENQGIFCNLEGLSELVNNTDLDEKLKHDIIEGYRTKCNLVD